jgi:DNA-binding NtrC family response regulator
VASQTIQGKKLVYRSRAFQDVLDRIEKIAQSDLPVLIRGESGVGKSLLARHIHDLSGRSGPFVSWSVLQTAPELACAAVFGASKGAYTGLDHAIVGVIEKARDGTLFLDEIDKSDRRLQAALLQLLDDGTFCSLGTTEPSKCRGRLLFATNRDLHELALAREFLSDLAHRLDILTIEIPPLRSRPDDIPPLVEHLAAQAASKLHRPPPTITKEAMSHLMKHAWLGNARQVSGVMVNLVASLNGTNAIMPEDVVDILRKPKRIAPDLMLIARGHENLPSWERKSKASIKRALHRAGGNGAAAARALGIPLRSFRALQKRFRLRRVDSAETVQE